ncbi:MAG: caspase family protein [Pyrinomonadaceae bacterium]|nr:caspase family protein [Pyrinomonadaceae bacterium]
MALLLSPSVIAQGGRDLKLSQTEGQINGKRIALVIGNGAYATSPLKNPPNDATDMAKSLSNVGFTVEHGINLTQRQMKAMIREFGQKLKAGGQGLFYFAGHGVQLKGRNYLIPVDAEITSESDVEDQGVDAALVLGLMDEAGNGLNVVILDACRNNPFARSFRSTTNGLAQVDAPTGTLVAYSTAPGKVARDGTGRNGAYTAQLLKQISVPGLPIEEVMKRVRANLKQLTNGEQVPWESSSLVGDFYFTALSSPANKESASSKVIPKSEVVNRDPIDPAAIELTYWDTIKHSTDAEDFKSYLLEYPVGQFASLARNRISHLEAASKTVEAKSVSADSSATELAFWDSIKTSTNADDYKAYLKRYPSGTFVELANNRLASIDIGIKEKEAAEVKRREAAEFAKISVAGTRWRGHSPGKDKEYIIEFAADGTFHMTLDFFGTYTINGPWTQNQLEVKGRDLQPSDSMPGMNGAEVNLTLTPDGQRMEGEWHKKNGKKYRLIMQRDSSSH